MSEPAAAIYGVFRTRGEHDQPLRQGSTSRQISDPGSARRERDRRSCQWSVSQCAVDSGKNAMRQDLEISIAGAQRRGGLQCQSTQ